MKIKRGFTLAEVLIVISVLAVFAVATIPAMLKSTTEKQYIMGLKKGYNALATSYASARIQGLHPIKKDGENYASKTKYTAIKNFYISILENTNVREVTKFSPNQDQGKSKMQYSLMQVKYKKTPVSNEKTLGTNTGGGVLNLTNDNDKKNLVVHTYITTEDSLSYYLVTDVPYTCQTKRAINKLTTLKEMIEASCVVAYIDVNGIHKGPNRFEPQQFNDITGKKRETLSGDQYYIFIGSDGVTSGNEKSNVTARVIEDLK